MSQEFHVSPYTERCARVWDQAEHAVIGLSVWNSYFSPRRVEALIGWAARAFTAIDVVIPSYESAYTLVAAGIPPLQAVRRARRAVVKLRVPARRALASAGPGEQHLHTTTSLCGRRRYRYLLRTARAGYQREPALRAACHAVAEQALRSVPGDVAERTPPTADQLAIAARYALAELPLLADAPGIFGKSSSLVLYHRHIPLADPLLSGATDAIGLCPHQGFAIATPATESPRTEGTPR
ncbi:tRNA-dependent cyclodipeptide synthase [Amycolatopsis minnesotensis]|uniref:Cyclodipeptide synthase n=1 Tax=Amycolatopsis minnesotensis TaxID=337894 RepID=A0ABP5E1C3_9PSEU